MESYNLWDINGFFLVNFKVYIDTGKNKEIEYNVILTNSIPLKLLPGDKIVIEGNILNYTNNTIKAKKIDFLPIF